MHSNQMHNRHQYTMQARAIEMEGPSEAIRAPGPDDILFGRGGHSNNNPGNKKYHAMLETRAWEYSRLKGRNAKTKLAWEVVNQLKEEGARFLQKDRDSSVYYEADNDETRKKVSQRLRELAKDVKDHEDSADDSSSVEPIDVPTPIALGNLKSDEDHSVLLDNDLLLQGLLEDEPAKEDPSPRKKEVPSYAFEPEILLSSSLHSDSSSLMADWGSDQAMCGSLDDLSDCSFETLVPYALGIHIEWPQDVPSFNCNASSASLFYPPRERLSHAFSADTDFMVPSPAFSTEEKTDRDYTTGRAAKRQRKSYHEV